MTSSANISLEQLQRIRGLRKTFLKVANDNEAAREVYMHNYHAVSVGGASVEAARRSPYPGIYPAAISVRTGVHLHPDLALQVMVENHPQPYRQFVSTLQDQVGQAQQQLSVEHMQRYRKGVIELFHKSHDVPPSAPQMQLDLAVPQSGYRAPRFNHRNSLNELNKMITYINEQQKLCMAQFQAENDELKADENKPEEQRNVSLSFRRYLVQHNYEKVAAWGSKLLRYMAVRDALFGFGKTDDPWHIHQAVLSGERLAWLLHNTGPEFQAAAGYVTHAAQLTQAKEYFETTMDNLRNQDAGVAQQVEAYFEEDEAMRLYMPVYLAGEQMKADARASSVTPPS